MEVVGPENICGGDHVLVGPSQFSQIQVRPNHALGVEDFHSRHIGLVGCGWLVDRVTMEHLGLK